MNQRYVHGYDLREALRLQDQAATLVELLHSDTAYGEGQTILEAGCGVGAQTIPLARNSPKALITSIDISERSVAQAETAAAAAGLTNVTFRKADIFDLPFAPGSFDHVFLCFVLEHLPHPVGALRALKRVLKTGGTITVIEGDHGSAYFYPDSEPAQKAIRCQVALQAKAGGNALIGRELYPLLRKAGFDAVRVSPRMVYVDSSKPELVEGFTKRTFTAMIEGVRGSALSSKLINETEFDQGIADLYRTAEADGVFCYTFFKAVGINNPTAKRQSQGSTLKASRPQVGTSGKNRMNRNRTIKSYTMNLKGTPDEIFPLLCPVREYEWVEPWKCEMVFSESGIAELDCVFKTDFPDDGPEDTWVVSSYEPPKCIEFVRINPLRSIRYRIELTGQDGGNTQAIWKQVITGLSAEGDQFVAGITDEGYDRKMEMLENMINHFLEAGEMLKITKKANFHG